jgi:hypothetical protein
VVAGGESGVAASADAHKRLHYESRPALTGR